MTVLRMNMKLCRHAFATDDQEPAWLLLEDIHSLRTIYKESFEHLMTPKLDQELADTLQLFEDRRIAKASLEKAMSACNIDGSSPDQFDNTGGTQQHSMCNFKLGLYAVAHKQANATLSCFRKLHGDDDPRVASAKSLLGRAEALKKQVQDAGIDWPTGEFTDWNNTAQFLSPEFVCGSPSNFDRPFTPQSHKANTFGRRSFHSRQRPPPPPRSYPQSDDFSFHEMPRHMSLQRITSWPLSETGSTSDDSAVYSPSSIDPLGYPFGTPKSMPADHLISEIEDEDDYTGRIDFE